MFSDVRDTGMVFRARDCRVLEAWGRLPHLMRAERREVSVPAKGDAKTTVWALAGDGTRRHAVKSVRTADAVVFTADVAADPQCATYLYEVVRE